MSYQTQQDFVFEPGTRETLQSLHQMARDDFLAWQQRSDLTNASLLTMPLDGSVDHLATTCIVRDEIERQRVWIQKELDRTQRLLHMNTLGRQRWEDRFANSHDKNNISPEAINAARASPLPDALAALGISLRPSSGSRFVALCPFHQEKSPSFVVFPDNHAHCFGCGFHGDSIATIQTLTQKTFQETVLYLARL